MDSLDNIKEVSKEIEEQNKLLNTVVDGISDFVATYELSKDDLSNATTVFKENAKNFSENLEKINKSLNSLNQENSGSLNEVLNQTKWLVEELDKTSQAQQQLLNFINQVGGFIEKIQLIDFEKLLKELKDNEEQIIDLKLSVTKMEQNITDNNSKLGYLSDKMSQFVEHNNSQQNILEKISTQLVSTNKFLKETSKQNNINTAVLFELMDEWFESKKKDKN